MPVWRFEPATFPEDPLWLGGPIWTELLVRAATAGEARRTAAAWEAARIGFDPERDTAGNAAMDYSSALADEKLYGLTEVADPRFPPDGPDEVLASSGGLDSTDPRLRGNRPRHDDA